MAWSFSGLSDSGNCCGIKQGRRLGVPRGAYALGVDVCSSHCVERESLRELVISQESRPEGMNPEDR